MPEKLAAVVIRFRWPVIAAFLLITVFFAFQIPKATIDPEMKNQLPADLPSRLDLDRIEKIFGGTDMVMVVMTAKDILDANTLKRLKKLSRGMERIHQVDRVLSVFTLKDIRADSGMLVVDPAVKRIPKTSVAREKLRQDLKNNDMVYGNVISKDFKAAAIIGMLEANAKDEETIRSLKRLIKNTPGPEPLYLAGMPIVRVQVGHDIKHDMSKFLPWGLLIMLAFLLACFRQLRGVILPFVVVIMSIVFSMGLIPLVGWKIQMITVVLPVILLAVANDYGIHVFARYQEENVPGLKAGSKELTKYVVSQLFYPVLITGITTIAGLMCLMTHIVVPAEQLGVLASAGVGFALIASLTFVPAWLAVLKKPKPILTVQKKDGHGKLGLLERMLAVVSELVLSRPKYVIAGFLIACLAGGSGVFFLIVDTDPMNYYEPDSPIVKASRLVDKKFGGSAAISVVAKGDIKSPKMLLSIDDVERKLAALPEVGETTSIARVVRRMNKVMHDGKITEDRIPDSRNAVAQYFLLYSMNGDPEDFEKMVDFNYEHALITARVNTLSVKAVDKMMAAASNEVKKYPKGMFPVVGGFIRVLADIAKAIVNGQISSLSLSLVLVSLLVALLFRSVIAGLLAAVPLTLSMILLFGLMGYFHIELNIATAMLSSIMIGVGVDYTIHFLWRYKQERIQNLLNPADAVRLTLTTTGRGIVFNALSVIVGFVVVLLSNFMPVKFFGFLVVVSIGSCLLGALVLLPCLCMVFRPGFLEPAGRA
ncbi:MAG: RND family transporter [Deltaproteobacteria bacterium]|nr:RND family transporter [Deltaproteobacteria bacterium]